MRAVGGDVTTDPYRAVLDALHRHGRTVRERGDTATAQCPAHDDASPSLSIARGKTQPVVLSCMAGCDTRAVLDALGLTEADICEDRPRTKSECVARYPYSDEHGELLYTVERWEPGFDGQRKTFVQRPANGRRGPGSMDGVRRVLYRLPEVVAAGHGTEGVWIVEGEKDADRLASIGLVATCNAGGAGKWRGEYLTHLHGADITIVADRDRPGYEHAQQVAEMIEHVAASVSVREPAAGKDVSDHLDAGLTINDLVRIDPAQRLAELGDDADENAADPAGLGLFEIDWSTFWDEEFDESDFICAPLLARGRGHAVYAGAKSGKSLLLLEAAAAMATGRAFLDKPAGEPVTVVYCDWEMTRSDLRERLEVYGYGPDDDLTHLKYILLPTIDGLDTQKGGETMLGYALTVGAEFVFIDTTSRAVEGEENSADTFRAFYRHTGMKLKQAGVGWCRVDHAGKSIEQGQRGSSAKNDDVDVVWQATLLKGDGQEILRLNATHRRVTWVPGTVDVLRDDDHSPVHTLRSESVALPYLEGTHAAAGYLDAAGVPADAGWRKVQEALAGWDGNPTRKLARSVAKYRKNEMARNVLSLVGRDAAAHPPAHQWAADNTAHLGPPDVTAGQDTRPTLRPTPAHPVEASGPGGAIPKNGPPPSPGSARSVDNYDETSQPAPWRPEDEEIWG